MTIEQTDKVDAIAVEIRSGRLVLSIFDHLDWSDVHAHLLALQDKLNTYIRFVESGELLTAYPDALGRKPVIDVVTQFEIPKACTQFLETVRPALEGAGIDLRTRVLPMPAPG